MPELEGKLVSTYSIVARCASTGQIGVAAQSCYFSVGSEATWLRPGVGAVATQAIHEISFGPRGLDLLAQDVAPQQVIDRLLADDPGAALRQLAIVDAKGRAAAHTGAFCVPAAGHHVGEGYSVQGNMLAADSVWQAMGPAFESAEGDLAERLLTALEAAERAGGDVRGRQSAALLITGGDPVVNAWEGRVVDLQVPDHPDPLAELRRLLTKRRAYTAFEQARERLAAGDAEASFALMDEALALNGSDPQISFWAGFGLANHGHAEAARAHLERAFAADEGWRVFAARLVALGIYSGDRALLEP